MTPSDAQRIERRLHTLAERSMKPEYSATLREAAALISKLRGDADMWMARCAAAVSFVPGDVLIGDLQNVTREYEERLAATAPMRAEKEDGRG